VPISALKRRWRHSAGLSFSLAYGLLYALSSALFLSFLWWRTIGLLERQVEMAVETDQHSLSEHWMQDGLPGLMLAIQDRLEQNIDDDAVYLLTAPDDRILAGNLPAWPTQITRTDIFYEMPILRDGIRVTTELHAYQLPGSFHLLVGRDVRGRAILRRLLTDTLIWSWGMVTLLAIGGALVVRGMFKRIVSSIARTTAAIAHGDLGQRMELTGNEVDLVATTVNDMLDRINRLMEGVKQVSNAIAHDLRTPISRARAQLEDASLHAETPQEMHDAIDRAVADLDHVTNIFEALLRISQIEAGARRAAFETFDLIPPLTDIAELYTAVAEDAGLRLDVDLPARQDLYGDARMIQQATANLLDNAIKFSPPGSIITLRCSLGTAPKPDRTLTISVSDQGIGMSDTDLTRASERFFRAEEARTTPGSGLGLALVQAVAQLHGGRLIMNRLDPGLRVAMRLPVTKNSKTVTQDVMKKPAS